MRLEVAAVAETVDVTGEAAQLSQSAEISQVIDEERLNELPLYNRNLNRAALLDPHVRNTQGLGGDGGVTARLSINGRIYRETHYKLDGNINFDAYTNNEPLQNVSVSAVQEYKVLSNQYAAEHGGTTAGFLIATTKSGTNDFHGEAFFFGRPSGMVRAIALSDHCRCVSTPRCARASSNVTSTVQRLTNHSSICTGSTSNFVDKKA